MLIERGQQAVKKEWMHGVAVAAACLVVLVCVGLLLVFLLTKPASAREVAQGKTILRTISEQTSIGSVKHAIGEETIRVHQMLTDFYGKCVLGVEQLAANLTWFDKTFDQLEQRIDGQL